MARWRQSSGRSPTSTTVARETLTGATLRRTVSTSPSARQYRGQRSMPAMETIERLVGEFVCLVKVKSVLNTDSDEIGCYHVMGRLRLNKTSYTANKGHGSCGGQQSLMPYHTHLSEELII